jgi:hypothetical protein
MLRSTRLATGSSCRGPFSFWRQNAHDRPPSRQSCKFSSEYRPAYRRRKTQIFIECSENRAHRRHRPAPYRRCRRIPAPYRRLPKRISTRGPRRVRTRPIPRRYLLALTPHSRPRNGLYARGSVIYADQFEEEDPAVRRGLIELQTHLVYEKQLRNLQLQEARKVRRREKEPLSSGACKPNVNSESRTRMASNFLLAQKLRGHMPPMRLRPMLEHIQTLPRTKRHPSIHHRYR